MAEEGSWPSIQQYGLLSTSELLSRYGYSGDAREEIECKWRRKKVIVERPGLPTVTIRDQIPMCPVSLKGCLEPGITTYAWYRLINGRIFFWPTWKDLTILLSANAYRNQPHVVIAIDTRSLLEKHGERVTLSGINSGSTYRPEMRGPGTFKPISDFDGPWVKEVVVERGIPSLNGLVKSAETWIARGVEYRSATFEKLGTLWP
jgi:hypothetical protein